MTEEEKIRLSKILSQRGICSRREADSYIKKGWIEVNGERITTLGFKTSPNAKINFSKNFEKKQSEKVTILLNKPVGFVSSQPEKSYKQALELITKDNQVTTDKRSFKKGHLRKLSPAGRLDIESKGLLIFSQDGTVVKELIGPKTEMEKEYFVRYRGRLTKEKINLLKFGLSLDGIKLKKARVRVKGPQMLLITLTEGKKRQIRRMLEEVDLEVEELIRIRIGKIKLEKIPSGQWRYLKPGETFS